MEKINRYITLLNTIKVTEPSTVMYERKNVWRLFVASTIYFREKSFGINDVCCVRNIVQWYIDICGSFESRNLSNFHKSVLLEKLNNL